MYLYRTGSGSGSERFEKSELNPGNSRHDPQQCYQDCFIVKNLTI
jgi:hypothetical protein